MNDGIRLLGKMIEFVDDEFIGGFDKFVFRNIKFLV